MLSLRNWPASTTFELRSVPEKSNFKAKNCPGVTLPSSMSFCTSRPCGNQASQSRCGSVDNAVTNLVAQLMSVRVLEAMEMLQHAYCQRFSEPARTEKEDRFFVSIQD